MHTHTHSYTVDLEIFVLTNKIFVGTTPYHIYVIVRINFCNIYVATIDYKNIVTTKISRFMVHTCTHTLLVPPKKKQKREKKSKGERVMESMMNSFMKYQMEAEKREEERWKKERELEERQRREDQQHELRVMQMLGQMLQHRSYDYPPPNSASYDYSYHDDTF